MDPERPDDREIERAAALLRAGALAAIPTDTLYALAADPFDSGAVSRVFVAKGRGSERALPLIACDMSQVARYFGELPSLAARLTERFWPGPLTLLVRAPITLASGVTGGTDKVGIRVPYHATATALCRACDRPLTATSANISGCAPTAEPDQVVHALGDVIDVLVDAGKTPGGAPSTVVDVTGAYPVLIREGAIGWEDVEAWLERRSQQDESVPRSSV